MKKKIISMLLCLTMVLQGSLPAFAEELIVWDEGTETADEIVLEEAVDLSGEDFGEDLIIDEGLFEDVSPELSNGDGALAGELAGGAQDESETEEVLTLESETETEAESEVSTEAAGGHTESSGEPDTEEDQKIQESEVSAEESLENGAVEETESEGLIEEETEELLESDLGEEVEIIMLEETVELADATVFSNNSFSRIRTFNLARYNGCFGNQLSGFALEIYNQRVQDYVIDQSIGTMVIKKDRDSSPYTFDAAIGTSNGKSYIIQSEAYVNFYNQILIDMQSSVDAFLYDHPEVFWLRSGTYSVSIYATKSQESATGWVGYLNSITYTPETAFSGATSYLLSYEAAVAQAAKQVQSVADENDDGRKTGAELIKAIHDYLCERLWYDNEAYNEYLVKMAEKQACEEKEIEWNGEIDYRIFCSAGAFLDSVGTGVVCEGYAKGFKVLCDKLDIPCVLIGGKVIQNGKNEPEGHMWNGVKVDGKWYFMDVTWDDSSSGYSYNYFLVGNITNGRATNGGNFMGAKYTVSFAYPTLENEKYEEAVEVIHNITETDVVEPTCIAQGYTDHLCSDEGCEYFYRDTYVEEDKTKHLFRYKVKAPTCTERGYTTEICRLCGAESIDETSYQKELGHNYKTVLKEATCTEQGYTTYTCSRCKNSYKGSYVSAAGHSYKTVIQMPTCTEGGYTTFTCTKDECGYSYIGDYTGVDLSNHNYQVSKVVEPTCTEQGYTVYRCSRCEALKNDTFKSPKGHSYKTVVTAPTHQAKGYTTYICTVAGCGYSYRGNEKEPVKNHTYKNGICSICGQGDTLTKATISKISSQGYDPKGVEPAITVKFGTNVLKKGIDYKVTCKNNKKLGTAKMTITGIGKYRGTVSKTFEVVKRKADKLTYSAVEDKTYTGKAWKPSVTVRNNGTKLKKNTDYTITYSNNKNIGQAVITIKMKGNYRGTKKLYFTILPKTVSVKTVTSTSRRKMKVTWKKVSGDASYQIQYSLNSNFKSAKTVTVKAKYTTKTIEKLTSKKTYYVRIRGYKKVSGKKYYSTWSKAKKVMIK